MPKAEKIKQSIVGILRAYAKAAIAIDSMYSYIYTMNRLL